MEVGPGLGTLTGTLLESGARVYAIEKDPTLAKHIGETLLKEYTDQLNLKEGDALDHPTGNAPQDVEYKIVANLPYAISTPWLDKVLHGHLPISMTLMLQKEAADRFLAKHDSKTFGAISIFLQSAYSLEGKHSVSGSCFYPKPDVDSTLIHLKKKSQPFLFRNETRELIRYLFGHRRKQLSGLIKGKISLEKAKKWKDHLEENGLSLSLRAENIPIDSWQFLDGIMQ